MRLKQSPETWRMSVPKLQVDVWSDVACPWCWVGVLRYKQAVTKLANRASVTTKFHPYMIDPATNMAGTHSVSRACWRSLWKDWAYENGKEANVTKRWTLQLSIMPGEATDWTEWGTQMIYCRMTLAGSFLLMINANFAKRSAWCRRRVYGIQQEALGIR